MTLSYSSYKNDIISFNSDEYLKGLNNNPILSNLFLKFIEYYKEIENEDFKKPVFSQTTKFKKIPNNFKYYKYLKINRNNDEPKNTWSFENPTEESEKISILIKSYLNKISQDTYEIISSDFINDILLIKNEKLFKILTSEILNKCLFDIKFRNLYINLCYKIWSNKEIHYNLVDIIHKNTQYYWKLNEDTHGPFTSEISLKNDIFFKINFKKYFLNYIQDLYINKNIFLENLSEEEEYINKKKIFLLVELVGLMFIEKYINFDIVNIIIIDLLHLNNNFKKIEDIEIEALYNLIKLIYDNKNIIIDLSEHIDIFNNFCNIIEKIINNNVISKRSNFFLTDIIIMLQNIKINNLKEDIKFIYNKDDITKYIIENNNKEILNIYKKINYNDKSDFIYKLIDIFLDKKNKNIIFILNKINDINNIYNVFDKIIKNIDDLILDIPDINFRLLYIIENLEETHCNKKKLINFLKNYDSESDSGSDSE